MFSHDVTYLKRNGKNRMNQMRLFLGKSFMSCNVKNVTLSCQNLKHDTPGDLRTQFLNRPVSLEGKTFFLPKKTSLNRITKHAKDFEKNPVRIKINFEL
jgi:hypothetical protein